MEIQEIEITISPAGEVAIAVRGAPGKKCLDLTRSLEDLLGGQVTSRDWTSEYSEPPGAQEVVSEERHRLR